MPRINLGTKIMIIVASFAAFSAIVFFTVIYPTMSYIKKINNDTRDLRIFLQKRYDATINLRSSRQKINQIKTDVAAFPRYLFGTEDELSLITTLEKIAVKNNISQKIESSNWDRPTDRQLFISLNVSGDYLNILKYLADLESLNFFLITEQIQLSPAFNSAKPLASPAVAVNLKLNLYVTP